MFLYAVGHGHIAYDVEKEEAYTVAKCIKMQSANGSQCVQILENFDKNTRLEKKTTHYILQNFL